MAPPARAEGQAVPFVWAVLLTVAVTARQIVRYGGALAASPPGIVPDDGRHFVVWLAQLGDPSLFAGDAIAAYFGSLTPLAYKALFMPAAWLGIDVVAWQMLVVGPLAFALSAIAAERFLARLLPDGHERAFVLVVLSLPAMAIAMDGLPRSFAAAILLATFWGFLARRPLAVAAVLFVGASLYPAAVLVAGSAIGLAGIATAIAERRIDHGVIVVLVAGAVGAVAGLAPFALSSSQYGATFSLAEARELPIFDEGGRTAFFVADPLHRILCDGRGGLLLFCSDGRPWFSLGMVVVPIVAGLLVLARMASRRGVSRDARLLPVALVVAGLILFALATAVAFQAHLPARYRQLSIDIVLVLSLGVLVLAGLTGVMRLLRRDSRLPVTIAAGLAALAGLWLVHAQVERDDHPALSRYLQAMPADTLVAGWSPYVGSIPAYARRPVFAALELTVPYKKGYYNLVAGRVATEVALYRGPVDAAWAETLAETGIDVFAVSREGHAGRWAGSFPEVAGVAADNVFARAPEAVAACTLATDGDLLLVDAVCFAREAASG